MIADLLGGEPQPFVGKRRVVQHQPVQAQLITFETEGMARERQALEGPGPEPRTAPYVKGSANSRKAARSQTPAKLSGKRLTLLTELCQRYPDGYTDNEIIAIMVGEHAWNPNSPRARRVELQRDGWLEGIGEKERLGSKRGTPSTVWRPTARAMKWYQGLTRALK